ncbi:hypothetical protein J8F10_05975 [Gemmata sp. G18]|uniref:Uncharacterized protein n=1 Tax=Gemmata palustris TaxID=2822762 RepID=A0ABS5BMA7_9BACT|nr:hypothetical protein [Gemmata palustris]MBP3954829.1 hypothetical protein [Gemmata palustris]
MAELERHARKCPYPGCGHVERPDPAGAEEFDLARLSAQEQGELARLVELVALPPCERCGRGGYDLTQLTDGQVDRALHLLRALFGHQELKRPGASDEIQGRPV